MYYSFFQLLVRHDDTLDLYDATACSMHVMNLLLVTIRNDLVNEIIPANAGSKYS